MAATRDSYIDFLRFIGVTLIVLAHVEAPHFLAQVRSFDVPLMIFVSGLCFSGREIKASFKDFYYPRLLRLVIPTYLFLTFYYIIVYLWGIDQSVDRIIKSYLLLNTGSVQYVWIIRVFILIMLATPFLTKVDGKSKNSSLILISLFALSFNEFLNLFCNRIDGFMVDVIETYIPYIIAYGVIFLFGLRAKRLTRKQENKVVILLSIITVFCVLFQLYSNDFVRNISEYKYPPRFYFIIYGLCSCSLLWRLRTDKIHNSFISFVGQNTMWIYLWHIFVLLMAKHIVRNWWQMYIAAYFGAILITFVQIWIVNVIQKKKKMSLLKYFKG